MALDSPLQQHPLTHPLEIFQSSSNNEVQRLKGGRITAALYIPSAWSFYQIKARGLDSCWALVVAVIWHGIRLSLARAKDCFAVNALRRYTQKGEEPILDEAESIICFFKLYVTIAFQQATFDRSKDLNKQGKAKEQQGWMRTRSMRGPGSRSKRAG